MMELLAAVGFILPESAISANSSAAGSVFAQHRRSVVATGPATDDTMLGFVLFFLNFLCFSKLIITHTGHFSFSS